jgi:hypothetical protein
MMKIRGKPGLQHRPQLLPREGERAGRGRVPKLPRFMRFADDGARAGFAVIPAKARTQMRDLPGKTISPGPRFRGNDK